MKRWIIGALLILTCIVTIPLIAQEKTGPVELKVVKYDGLMDAVLRNRGRVVVVDFWASY